MTTVAPRPMSSRIGRGLGWSTGTNVVLRLGSLLVSVLTARLLSPDEFGVFAVALTVWVILGTVAEFGLGADLVRSADFQRRAPTVATLGLATSCILAVSMFVAAPLVADAFRTPQSAEVIRLMATSLVVFGLSIVPAAHLQREFRQRDLFVINGCALVTSASTMAVLALSGIGAMSLAYGHVVGQLVMLMLQYRRAGVPLRFGFVPSYARESAAFCLPLAVANLISWVLLSVDNVVVARALGSYELGLYVLAFNISSWPMSAVGQSLRAVALPAFARINNPGSRGSALQRSAAVVWSLSLPMGVLLATLAVPAVTLLYGERWRPAATAMVGLALFGSLRVVFDLFATFLVSVGATGRVLVVQMVWVVSMIPAMVLAVGRFGIAGAGWAHVLISAAVVLPAYLVCLRSVGVASARILAGCALPTVAVLPLAASTWLAASLFESPVAALCTGTLLAVVLYVLPIGKWWIRQLRSLSRLEAELIESERAQR